jgi:predicted permease
MNDPSRLRSPRQNGADDVDAELQFHLETRARDLIAAGATAEAARAQAEREFGDLEDARRYLRRVDERVRAASRRERYMKDFRNDLAYAFRRLRAAPAFAVTAVLTMALGIGANTAIFSIVNGVLLRPLPFPHPASLYAVYSANRTANQLQASVSAVDLDDWRAQRHAIDDLGGYWYGEGSSGVDLTGRGEPKRLSAVFVTPGFFSTLGVQARAGRLPREDEMVRGGPDKVVVLTSGFWAREFGESPSVVGSTITLSGVPYDVLGVLPADMRFPSGNADVFVPFSTIPDSGIPRIRPVRVLNVIGRAASGVSREGVVAEMLVITGRLATQYSSDRAWDAATVVPLAEVVSGPVRPALLVLAGAVGLVLLIASVNVAVLQLARAMGRGREIAVRLALGARRGRLIRQLLTESLLVSMVGGALGLGVATIGTSGLLALGAGQVPRAQEVTIDLTVVLFAAGLSVLTGLVFGIVPALGASRGDARLLLHDTRRSVAGPGNHRVRAALVVTEVAVAMALVVGAGLMSRSFLALIDTDAGFRPDHLIAVQFTIDATRHGAPNPPPGTPASPGSPYTTYYTQVIEHVRTLPGVVSAAAVKDAPFRGNGERNGFNLPGRPVPAGEDPPSATAIHISDGYFKTIGARMVDGREFTPEDRLGTSPVVIVNDAFARQFFPGERAVGKRLLVNGSGGESIEVVGVVNDIRQVAMSEPARSTLYWNNLQNSRVKTTIVARTAGDPVAMAAAIRQTIWSIDPDQPITSVFTFEDAVSDALARPRLLTVLLGAFGFVGLALGAIGIYGMLVALVNERRREIGVRLALGAQPGQILRMVVGRGLALTLVGVVAGLAAAFALSRLLVAVLYGIRPADPLTFAGMALVLVLTAALASWLPARRAAALDPVETLRAD